MPVCLPTDLTTRVYFGKDLGKNGLASHVQKQQNEHYEYILTLLHLRIFSDFESIVLFSW